jgi:hypothetical protein
MSAPLSVVSAGNRETLNCGRYWALSGVCVGCDVDPLVHKGRIVQLAVADKREGGPVELRQIEH